MSIKKSDRFKISDDVRIEFLDDEAIIVNLEEEMLFSVNDTSANILKIISEGNSYGKLKELIQKKYDIEFEDKKEEIEDFISQLINQGIIVKNVY